MPKRSEKDTTNIPEISVLVPVMNEAGNIRPLIDEICETLSGRNFEIIYIDDASNDASPAELADTQAVISQLRVLRHHRRAGQSAAIRSGLLRARGDLIAVLDGDGQNVPADLPNLEQALLAGGPALYASNAEELKLSDADAPGVAFDFRSLARDQKLQVID